ncbi:MAG: Nramp family divalent metal transporter [Saprospiraceae bacterium]|nr:Nramp family divalent metal transporter [Saprospiraceae bacterium]
MTYDNNMLRWLKDSGPGAVITAAFIGPGTVTVCTLAGNQFGYSLLWVILFALLATIILQEMSARLGIITSAGLSESLRMTISRKWVFHVAALLIFLAVFVGNSAFEGGNISGTGIGIQLIWPETKQASIYLYPLIGGMAGILLFFGNYKRLQTILTWIVILMSISFLMTAILIRPDLAAIIKNTFVPNAPEGSWISILGIIGTTIVPYNLFLHASLAAKKWKSTDLKAARTDIIRAIIVGCVISACIMICGAAVQHIQIHHISELPTALEPLMGQYAGIFFGFGLTAAGLTSAVTAPMAASLAICGIFGWSTDPKTTKYRLIWLTVLCTGTAISVSGYKPIQIIKSAQFANGLLLPVIVAFLIYAVNNHRLMQGKSNSLIQNFLAVLVWLICIALGIKSMVTVIL